MKPSATVAINELSHALAAQGREIFKLGLGQSPFPVPRTVVEALRQNAHQKDYLQVVGLPALREAVASYHRRAQGLHVSPDRVLIGPGSKELMFLLQLVYDGDLVIPAPSWVSYAPQAKIIGRQVRWVATRRDNKWRLTADGLEQLCQVEPERPRLVVLNYPNNPTGYTYAEAELRALASTARKYGVLLLSDEIYGELDHQGAHVSIAEHYPEGTIVSAGLSKWCGAGGWRLGTFAFPAGLEWLRDAMAAVASETFTSTSAPIQYAAVRAYEGGPEIDDYLAGSRRILSALGRWCAARLRSAGIEVADPDGAFYLMPDFTPLSPSLLARGVADSPTLARRVLDETGVAFLPGVDFGRDPGELTVRIAYVDFDGTVALEAAATVPAGTPLDEAFLRRTCPRVTAAIDRIGEWAGKAGGG